MQTIAELEKKLEDLPLLPTVIVRLLSLDVNDDDYFDHILKLAQEDPTFALRIIKLSNSAVSAPVNPIVTLRDAVIRLGVKSVAGMVTSLSAVRVFIPTKQGEKNLWVHSIQVAVCAKIIAQTAVQLKVNPEQAYICGLLHDIGRFVLFDKESDALNLVEESNWDSPEQLVMTEKDLYGFNHSELGGRVCRKWELPESIIEVVANHHAYDLPASIANDSKSSNLIRVIQMADFFSVFMMLNPDATSWDLDVLEKEINEKCVSPSSSTPPISAKQLIAQVDHFIEESNKMVLGLGVGA